MSIIYTVLVLLHLLLSLHSCNARVVQNNHAKELFHHYITKENEVMSEGLRHVLSEKAVGESDDAEKGKSSVNAARDSKKTNYMVPHMKVGGGRRDPEAGFDLDYLPPRTHPPSNN